MGKVDCIQIAGLVLWFPSTDHLPPHFHARKPGHWEIRVFFLLCRKGRLNFDLKWPPGLSGPGRQHRKRLLSAVLEKRVLLLKEWETKVNRE